jgi:hypothetical protein
MIETIIKMYGFNFFMNATSTCQRRSKISELGPHFQKLYYLTSCYEFALLTDDSVSSLFPFRPVYLLLSTESSTFICGIQAIPQ